MISRSRNLRRNMEMGKSSLDKAGFTQMRDRMRIYGEILLNSVEKTDII